MAAAEAEAEAPMGARGADDDRHASLPLLTWGSGLIAITQRCNHANGMHAQPRGCTKAAPSCATVPADPFWQYWQACLPGLRMHGPATPHHPV